MMKSEKPENSEIHRSPQNRASSCMELLVTVLAPRIWRWLLDVGRFADPCFYVYQPNFGGGYARTNIA